MDSRWLRARLSRSSELLAPRIELGRPYDRGILSPLRLHVPPPIIQGMGLQQTLKRAHEVLGAAKIDHALIGGLGLAALGVHRATFDVDFLILGYQKEQLKKAMQSAGWKLTMETAEVLHFEGAGRVDFLLANRPLTQEMLSDAKASGVGMKCVSAEGIIGLKIQAFKNDSNREFKDKADIQALIEIHSNLDWAKVKTYADLFGEWPFIESLKGKVDDI